MIYQSTEKIREALESYGKLCVQVEENDDFSMVCVLFPGLNKRTQYVGFISTDQDNDVHVIVPKILSVSKRKIPYALAMLNAFNRKFRPVKFYCDEDGDVNVVYDYLTSETDPSASAVKLHFQMARAAIMGANMLNEALEKLPEE